MPSILDQLEAKRARDDNQELARASHDAAWSGFFNAPASREKLRADTNLNELVDQAIDRKRQVSEQNMKPLDFARMMAVKAKAAHDAEMAPERIRHVQAQTEAALAAERANVQRATLTAKAEKLKSEHVTGFSEGLQSALDNFNDDNSPEFHRAVRGLAAKYPMAKTDFAPFITNSNAMLAKEAESAAAPANAQALAEARARGAAAGAPEQGFRGTPEEARTYYGPEAVLSETSKGYWKGTIKPPTAAKLPEGVTTLYAKTTGEISGLDERLKASPEDKELIAKRAKADQTRLSLEAKHPGLTGATSAAPVTAQAASSPTESLAQIAARIKASGGSKEDYLKAAKDAGHNY